MVFSLAGLAPIQYTLATPMKSNIVVSHSVVERLNRMPASYMQIQYYIYTYIYIYLSHVYRCLYIYIYLYVYTNTCMYMYTYTS